ncbi:hypothetical protein HN51_027885 [Arachis hypogaea]
MRSTVLWWTTRSGTSVTLSSFVSYNSSIPSVHSFNKLLLSFYWFHRASNWKEALPPGISMRWIHHLKMRIRELINVVLAVPKIKFLFLGGCGEAYYCSTSGAEADWESSHSLLCTGERSDPAHREALLKFNKHPNVAMSIKIGTVDFRDDIVIWARKKTGSSVIRINSKKEAEEFLTKYHTFVIGRFDKFEGHEYDEFVRAAKLDNEPEIYTAYDGAFTTSKILEFLDYNNFPLVYMNELEAAKSEIQSWHSSIQNEPCVPTGATPEPKILLDYLQALKSSEESLREQLLKAKKKEAAFIVTFAK